MHTQRLVLALILAIAVGSIRQTVEAQSNTVYVSSKLMVNGLPIYGSGRTLTICKGEKITKTVWIRMWTSRINVFFNRGGWSATNQLISASSSNTQVATVSPGTSVTGVNPSTSRAYTQFTIKGVDVGSTSITFSDGGSLSTNASYNRPRADPRSLNVTVKECVFEVTGVSNWQIPEGFQPILTSQFSWIIQPRSDGTFDEQNVLVRNSAVLGQHYFASGRTTEQIKAYASTVEISGMVDWAVSEIELVFSYETVKGRMDLDCPGCLRPVHGESTGFGTPYAEIVSGPTSGFSTTKPHALEYLDRFGNLATTTGTLNITVVRIYR